jgi:hypothetical protein
MMLLLKTIQANRSPLRAVSAAALVTAVALVAATPGLAHDRGHDRGARPSHTAGTALTGATLTSATTAAQAAVKATTTVVAARTVTESRIPGAAYEVELASSTGARFLVIEDSSFTVLRKFERPACLRARERFGHRYWRDWRRDPGARSMIRACTGARDHAAGQRPADGKPVASGRV